MSLPTERCRCPRCWPAILVTPLGLRTTFEVFGGVVAALALIVASRRGEPGRGSETSSEPRRVRTPLRDAPAEVRSAPGSGRSSPRHEAQRHQTAGDGQRAQRADVLAEEARSAAAPRGTRRSRSSPPRSPAPGRARVVAGRAHPHGKPSDVPRPQSAAPALRPASAEPRRRPARARRAPSSAEDPDRRDPPVAVDAARRRTTGRASSPRGRPRTSARPAPRPRRSRRSRRRRASRCRALGERRGEHEQADEQRARLPPGLQRRGARPARPARDASGRKSRTASGPATATIAGNSSRCTVAETASATIAAPTSAPATVPTLNPAWKRGMIARPSSCSTAEPSTFIATSHVPMPAPRANSPTTSGATPTRYPSPAVASPAAASSAIALTVRAVPSRPTTRPDRGIEVTDPTAIARSTSPRLRGVSSSASRTCGIRDAQLANAKPLRMKTA